MNPVSTKKAASDAVYAEARDRVMWRAYGRCEANTPACPTREHEATQVHHVWPRSHAPADVVHTPGNLLAVCDAAHTHIHANPEASYAAGWLKRSTADL